MMPFKNVTMRLPSEDIEDKAEALGAAVCAPRVGKLREPGEGVVFLVKIDAVNWSAGVCGRLQDADILPMIACFEEVVKKLENGGGLL